MEGERKLNWSLNKVHSIRNLSLNNLTKVKTSVSFLNYFLDFLRIGDFYYVLTTDVHAIKRDMYDYLSKYDDKFNLIWEKRLNVKKSALQKSFLHVLKEEKSFFYISNEWKPKTNKRDVVVYKYDLDGVLKTKSKYNQKGYSDINASMCLNENSFLVVNDISSDSNRRMKSWAAKFNSDTKTVWEKEYDSIHVKKVIQLNNKNLLFFGKEGYDGSLKIIKTDSLGNSIRKKKLKGNIATDVIQIKNGNILFFILEETEMYQKYKGKVVEVDEKFNIVKETILKQTFLTNILPTFFEHENEIKIISAIEKIKDLREPEKSITIISSF